MSGFLDAAKILSNHGGLSFLLAQKILKFLYFYKKLFIHRKLKNWATSINNTFKHGHQYESAQPPFHNKHVSSWNMIIQLAVTHHRTKSSFFCKMVVFKSFFDHPNNSNVISLLGNCERLYFSKIQVFGTLSAGWCSGNIIFPTQKIWVQILSNASRPVTKLRIGTASAGGTHSLAR